MNNKKGVASTAIIYSFFVIFTMILIASVVTFSNKKQMIEKIEVPKPPTKDYNVCKKSDTLADCLFKQEYDDYAGVIASDYLTNVKNRRDANEIKEELKARTAPDFATPASSYEGIYCTDDYDGTTSVSYSTSNHEYSTKYNTNKSCYYRGDGDDYSANNYVTFAGMSWRIVRIEDVDDSKRIRLILDDVPSSHAEYNTLMHDADQTEGSSFRTYNGATQNFSYSEDGNNYKKKRLLTHFNDFNSNYGKILTTTKTESPLCQSGYMYGGVDTNSNLENYLDEKAKIYGNNKDSIIKMTVDMFYNKNIKLNYNKYIYQNTLFIGDKNVIVGMDYNDEDLKKACKGYTTGLNQKLCASPIFGLKGLSSAKAKMTFFEGLARVYSNAPSLIIGESNKNANNQCNQALNLSYYSTSGGVKFNAYVGSLETQGYTNFGSDADWNHNGAATNKCGKGDENGKVLSVEYCEDTSCRDEGSCEAKASGCGGTWNTIKAHCSNPQYKTRLACTHDKNGSNTWYPETSSCSDGSCRKKTDCERPANACKSKWHKSTKYSVDLTNKAMYAAYKNEKLKLVNEENVVGNGSLKYPIGLISADEVIFSGETFSSSDTTSDTKGKSAISSKTFKNYWTSTLAMYDGNDSLTAEIFKTQYLKNYLYKGIDDFKAAYYFVSADGTIKIEGNTYLDKADNGGLYARPVITLNGDVKWCKGSGQKSSPYKILSDDGKTCLE